MATGGDVNGDGVDDLLVGAPESGLECGESSTGNGTVYLLYGPLQGEIDLATADARLLGDHLKDGAGWGATIAGDIDGDGFDDVVVGAPGYDSGATEGGTDEGAVYLFYGPVTGTKRLGEADAILLGFVPADGAGHAISAGDVNADGHDDLFIGAPRARDQSEDGGSGYLILGAPRLPVKTR